MQHTTIAVDVAKSVFQVAISHTPGRVDAEHRLSRARFLAFFANHPASTVLLEACGSAHHWGRALETDATARPSMGLARPGDRPWGGPGGSHRGTADRGPVHGRAPGTDTAATGTLTRERAILSTAAVWFAQKPAPNTVRGSGA